MSETETSLALFMQKPNADDRKPPDAEISGMRGGGCCMADQAELLIKSKTINCALRYRSCHKVSERPGRRSIRTAVMAIVGFLLVS